MTEPHLVCPHHPDLQQARSVLARIVDGTLTAVTHYDQCKDNIPGQVGLFHWTLTIDQLRQALDNTGLPGNTPVVIPTGCGEASPLSGTDTVHYRPRSTWRGDITDQDDPHATLVLLLDTTG
jgi:hypothetical protein